MKDTQLHFSIGAVDVALRSDCRLFVDEYLSLYAPYRRASAGKNAVEIDICCAHRFPWRRGPYSLSSGGVEGFKVQRRFEVLPHLEWLINWQIIHHRSDLVQLHAGCLTHAGRSLILAGDPGSGKSTLTAGLMASGWSYLCDEFALVQPDTLEVHPFPRALCMKEPSFPVIDKLGLPLCRRTPYHKPTKGRVAFLNPLDVRPDVVGKPSPVGWVIFPKYVAGAAPHAVPMSRAEAAYELARQCFNFRAVGARTMTVLANVVRSAACFRLTSGEIHATCDLVNELVEQDVAPRALCA